MDKKQITIDFAMKQLQKVFSDLKSGKHPTIPKSLEKITAIVEKVSKKEIGEDEAEKLINEIVDKEKKRK